MLEDGQLQKLIHHNSLETPTNALRFEQVKNLNQQKKEEPLPRKLSNNSFLSRNRLLQSSNNF